MPVQIGGSGKRKKTIEGRRHGPHTGPRATTEAVMRSQGLPADFLADAPFTKDGKIHAVGNGVPLEMGRAVARAVAKAMGISMEHAA